MHAVDYSYQLCGTEKEKNQVKWRSDERGRNSEIRGGKYWLGVKIEFREKRKEKYEGKCEGCWKERKT